MHTIYFPNLLIRKFELLDETTINVIENSADILGLIKLQMDSDILAVKVLYLGPLQIQPKRLPQFPSTPTTLTTMCRITLFVSLASNCTFSNRLQGTQIVVRSFPHCAHCHKREWKTVSLYLNRRQKVLFLRL